MPREERRQQAYLELVTDLHEVALALGDLARGTETH